MKTVKAHLGHVNQNRFLLFDLRGTHQICHQILGQMSSDLCSSSFIDDLIVLEDSDKAAARMRVFGGDAREADFCGNGTLLCLHILFQETTHHNGGFRETTLETKWGIRRGIIEKNGQIFVETGSVLTCDQKIAGFKIDRDTQKQIERCEAKLEGFRIAGEPHLVISVERGSPLFNAGRSEFENCAEKIISTVDYEGHVNLTMLLAPSAKQIEIRTFERGVWRMTESCGSGAVAAASVLFNRSPSKIQFEISSPGGPHTVTTDPQGETWWLSGPIYHCDLGQLSNPSIYANQSS